MGFAILPGWAAFCTVDAHPFTSVEGIRADLAALRDADIAEVRAVLESSYPDAPAVGRDHHGGDVRIALKRISLDRLCVRR